jgi:membrane-associated phospholipid phosphatase
MPGESFDSGFLVRLTRLWQLKLALMACVLVVFCAPYIYLAHHPIFPVHTLPLTALDRAAGFDVRWVWVYQSIYLLTGTIPLLAIHWHELRRFLVGFAWLVGSAFVFFVFWPVAVPRPVVESPGWLYAMLLSYDGPYSAFPSLHAGFLYYNLAFARRIIPGMSRPAFAVLVVWALLILWATLATKQHYAIDLLGGIALAIGADVLAWRSSARTTESNPGPGSR